MPDPTTNPADLKLLDELQSRLPQVQLRDRHRLGRRLAGLRRTGRFDSEVLRELASAIMASEALIDARRGSPGEIGFPSDLPVAQALEELQVAIESNQVTVLCGETGSGKSTQLPKLLMAMGRGVFGRIGHTQPRRIAARSLAARIASEVGQELGHAIGYKVRFHDHVSPQTRVKLLTDGMLLAEVQRDRWLNEYDTLIIDEAHERSLNIDFLMGYLRELLPKRPDLKLIITSATIDPERFAQHFGGAPIINVSGRTHPVETRYRAPGDESVGERDDGMQQAIVDAVDELGREDRGDILVFLSGEREIRETAETLHHHKLRGTEVIPLYARQGSKDQGRVFQPGGARRIILATNVAETSLTVPGIKHVIDAGYARISRYSHKSKLQRLPVERVSRASAEQRKGRCGRTAPGICIRLYSEDNFEDRREFTEPEILRTNLASVILQMMVLGFGDIGRFPFVEPPDPRQIKDGYRVLHELGAVDGERRVTRIGKDLARLPVDPRIGRMLLQGAKHGCLREVLVIAAALSVQDPRDRPMDKQQAADEAHAEYQDERSDFLGYLKLWTDLEEHRRHLTRRKYQRYCRERFISWNRAQEWHDIHRQLQLQMHELGHRENEGEPDYEVLHAALLSGLLSHVGIRDQEKPKEYLGARNSRFMIFPGSGVFGTPPKWVMAAELVETTRLYARGVAGVQPEWIERQAGHLVTRSYSEPHWQGRRGQVGAYEKVSLYGLTLVPRRRINYGPLNPVEAREIFIRFALVEGDFHTRAPFWRHNQGLLDDLHALEAKTRRSDILVDEETRYQFYDQRIPEGIYSKAQFERWLRGVTKDQPRFLHMRMQDLVRQDPESLGADAYPDQLALGGLRLRLEYHFEPGKAQDGVTLVAPADVLAQLEPARLQWLVPGLLREKVVALIKSLPKQLRRNFVPVPDVADRAMKLLAPSDTPVHQALGRVLRQLTGVQVPEDAWDEQALPAHLRMRLRVIDGAGRSLAEGDDVPSLVRTHAGSITAAPVSSKADPLERDGITRWDFGELPDRQAGQGMDMPTWPTVVDLGDSVGLRLLHSETQHRRLHPAGLRRLLMLTLAGDMRYLKREFKSVDKLKLAYAKVPRRGQGDQPDLIEQLLAISVDQTFLHDAPEPRSAENFDALIAQRKPRLVRTAQQVRDLAESILTSYQAMRAGLAKVTQINYLASVQDMQTQLDELVYQGFLIEETYAQLRHYPRYLKAMRLRLQRMPLDAARDQARIRELAGIEQDWRGRSNAAREQARVDERLQEIGAMLQELRVSLFAQELKTAYPVSVKRIRQRWRDLGL